MPTSLPRITQSVISYFVAPSSGHAQRRPAVGHVTRRPNPLSQLPRVEVSQPSPGLRALLLLLVPLLLIAAVSVPLGLELSSAISDGQQAISSLR